MNKYLFSFSAPAKKWLYLGLEDPFWEPKGVFWNMMENIDWRRGRVGRVVSNPGASNHFYAPYHTYGQFLRGNH